MAVLSCLRACKRLPAHLLKPVSSCQVDGANYIVPFRRMGGDVRRMQIRPSQWEWRHFKDQLHLYVMLGIIPLGALIMYCNVFIGKAELVDIPEGYEPKTWEYHAHPIRRWFARYAYDPPEKTYEMQCALIDRELKKAQHYLLEQKVKNLMAKRGDYVGWYYVAPYDERHTYLARETSDERGHDVKQAGFRTS